MSISILLTTNCLLLLLISVQQSVKCRLTTITTEHRQAGHSLVLSTTQPPPTTTVPQELPEFVEPIGNHTVALGRDAQLSCKIENLAQFRTAWLRVEDKGILTIHNNIITRNYRFGLINNDLDDGRKGKQFVLTIKNVQPSDKGGYMCQINSVPMKYAIGYLDVLTPPAFEDSGVADSAGGSATTQQPQTLSLITVKEGSNASLLCKANGHPQPIITWRREDNEPIMLKNAKTNELEEYPKLEGPTIQLNSVTKSNSGAYLCIASNGVQPSASKRQVLDVQYAPIIRLPQTELGAHLQQYEAKLSCIIESNPKSSYYWVKIPGSNGNGNKRTTGDQLEGSSTFLEESADDLALIEHESLSNSDKYDIIVNNNGPASRQDSTAQTADSEKTELILAIKRIERHDFAHYKCIARNSLGLQSSSIRLFEQTASSFSLNNMFRGGGSSPDAPPEDQEGVKAGKPQLSTARTYTRSSWIQKPSSRDYSPSSRALADPSSSSAALPVAYRSLFSLLFILIALVAQIVDNYHYHL